MAPIAVLSKLIPTSQGKQAFRELRQGDIFKHNINLSLINEQVTTNAASYGRANHLYTKRCSIYFST